MLWKCQDRRAARKMALSNTTHKRAERGKTICLSRSHMLVYHLQPICSVASCSASWGEGGMLPRPLSLPSCAPFSFCISNRSIGGISYSSGDWSAGTLRDALRAAFVKHCTVCLNCFWICSRRAQQAAHLGVEERRQTLMSHPCIVAPTYHLLRPTRAVLYIFVWQITCLNNMHLKKNNYVHRHYKAHYFI